MEMRRKDRMLNQEETIDILNKSEYGVLSTIGKDNSPYGVPINFAYVDGVVYFHCAKAKGYKIINIMNNSNVCLTVVNDVCLQPEILSTKYRSAILFGKVSIVEDMEEKKKGLEALIKKLSPEYMEVGMKCIDKNTDNTCILKMEVVEMTGKGKKQ
ncbi:pyridoxamine 5'-phosphate oxidase family protein [Intestinibacter bartlettii]|uniref:Pyridoxamine 5'-phosphate oxidase family protein n=1 Tax=Intestinibacter bartlettii TaxID=261299 RepID=A0ABS6DUM8_9FIRM|nr:pyridoxamine 5'-phosphate oxidase family protein [Intestinibacter bartlettii]MBU5335541.1 pyridoxamine 5'-phosphate oxidase family protein [Intestinibacter bartlettii]